MSVRTGPPELPSPPPAPLVPESGDPALIWFGRWLKVLCAGAFALSAILSFVAPIRAALGGSVLANIAIGGLVGTGVGLLIQELGQHSSLLLIGAVVLVVLPLAYKAWKNRREIKRVASDLGVDRRQLFNQEALPLDAPEHHTEQESPQHHPTSPSPSVEDSGYTAQPPIHGAQKRGKAEAGVFPQIRESESDASDG